MFTQNLRTMIRNQLVSGNCRGPLCISCLLLYCLTHTGSLNTKQILAAMY